jgi:hypothetical protein
MASLTTLVQEQPAGIGLADTLVWANDAPASKLIPTAINTVDDPCMLKAVACGYNSRLFVHIWHAYKQPVSIYTVTVLPGTATG